MNPPATLLLSLLAQCAFRSFREPSWEKLYLHERCLSHCRPESSRVASSRSTEQLDPTVRIVNGKGETRGLRLGDDGQLPGAALGSDEEQPDPAGL